MSKKWKVLLRSSTISRPDIIQIYRNTCVYKLFISMCVFVKASIVITFQQKIMFLFSTNLKYTRPFKYGFLSWSRVGWLAELFDWLEVLFFECPGLFYDLVFHCEVLKVCCMWQTEFRHAPASRIQRRRRIVPDARYKTKKYYVYSCICA